MEPRRLPPLQIDTDAQPPGEPATGGPTPPHSTLPSAKTPSHRNLVLLLAVLLLAGGALVVGGVVVFAFVLPKGIALPFARAAQPSASSAAAPAPAPASTPEAARNPKSLQADQQPEPTTPTGRWGWSDRCWKLLHQDKLDEADHACDQGLAAAPADFKVRAALLYNKGLIAEKRGNRLTAESFFRKSLGIRAYKDPGRREVQAALFRVLGLTPATRSYTSYYCSPGVRCRRGQRCCPGAPQPCVSADSTCALGSSTTVGYMCDPDTNEPCAATYKCRAAKAGHGPLTMTADCGP